MAAALMEEAASPEARTGTRRVHLLPGFIYILLMFGLALVIDNFLEQHRALTPHFRGLTELFSFRVDIDLFLGNYLL